MRLCVVSQKVSRVTLKRGSVGESESDARICERQWPLVIGPTMRAQKTQTEMTLQRPKSALFVGSFSEEGCEWEKLQRWLWEEEHGERREGRWEGRWEQEEEGKKGRVGVCLCG